MSKIRTLFYLIIFVGLKTTVSSQNESLKSIGLSDIISIANKKSLASFKIQREYTADYWRYRSFGASLLPKIDFTTEPFTFTRSFVRRYDNENNIDVFRLQQNLFSFGQISITQNVLFSNAKIYASSSLGRLANNGENTFENYSATPIQIGIEQPIMAFNELKWQRKSLDLEFAVAKQDVVYGYQSINLEVLKLFFEWALADAQFDLALINLSNSDKILSIGNKKYEIGSIERDELLSLKLEKNSAQSSLVNAQNYKNEALSKLEIYLGVKLENNKPKLPEMVFNIYIDNDEALKLAKTNNPKFLNIEIDRIYAEKDFDRIVKENRFKLSINASYGLNQQSNSLSSAYSDFLEQQLVAVTFTLPLVDWGERKGKIETAKQTKEIKEIELNQTQNNLIQEVYNAVSNFNSQHDLVVNSQEAKSIASETYELIEKKFLRGNVDLLRLINVREAKLNTSLNYIETLKNFWEAYYKIQQLTLFDFKTSQTLKNSYSSSKMN